MVVKTAWNSVGYERIPYAAEQGNNSLDQGMFSREQGIIIAKSRLGGGALNRLGEDGAWSLEDLKIEFEAPYRRQSGAESPERHCDLAAFRGGDGRVTLDEGWR